MIHEFCDFEIIGARKRVLNKGKFIDELNSFSNNKAVIQAINASVICGIEHIEFALKKALESWEKDPISSNLGIEILLHTLGLRQINKAIEKGGIEEGEADLCLIFSDINWKDLETRFDLERDDSILSPDKIDLKKIMDIFDISEEELNVVGSKKIPLLAREKISLLRYEK
ncbi:MAG: Subunit of KEOPS complex Cgi121 [Candidatus Methanohalarchaeum thermophilum]|uniref:Subunit of KEOPS complex Cgi121 n=1 Tax=Methanohalarchaeum thermophilum TaxID=1903181 RepID=A0A1Q6DU48_METT1|nr:MAG: Subunit of KEOPS complex Cgi121 [Candidatus Methanohalarchaeum thermophilum]